MEDGFTRRTLPGDGGAYREYLREIRAALDGDDPAVDELLEDCNAWFPDREPLLEIGTTDPDWWKQRPVGIRERFLQALTARSLLHLEPGDDAVSLLRELAHAGRATRFEGALAIQQLLLRDEREAAFELWEAGVGWRDPHLGVWVAQARGDLGTALALLEDAPGISRCELPGLAAIVACLEAGEAERAEALLAEALPAGGAAEFPFWVLSEALEARRTGPARALRRLQKCHTSGIDGGLNRLFAGLGLYWLDVDRARALVPELEEFRDRARRAGYAWPARETEQLLDRLHGRAARPGLVDLFPARHRWQLALEAIERLAGSQRKKRKVHQGSRLAWCLEEPEPGLYEVWPALQQPDGAGGFTPGRRVKLREAEKLDILTDQDRRVCSFIIGRGDGAHLPQPEALFELIGHPAVFWMDPWVRVEVTRGQPGVSVLRQEEGVRLEAHPEPTPDRSALLIRKEGVRLCLYEITPTYRKLARILDEGMFLPAEATDRLPELIERLSALIPVHSEVEARTTLIRAEPDARPRVRLRPFGEGLEVRVVSRPLGTEGSAFPPGEGVETVIGQLGGEPREARRDREDELRRARAMAEACPALRLEPPRWETVLPEVAACLEGLEQLQALGDEVVLEWPEGEAFRLRRGRELVRVKLGSGQDWLGVDGELAVDEKLVLSLRQLLDRLREETGRFVPLGQGQFLALTREFHQRLLRLRALTEHRGRGLGVHTSAVLEVEEVTAGWPAEIDPVWEESRERLRCAQDAPIEVPAELQTRLRDYQADGFRWLARLAWLGYGACLADEMGLGKTVQCLAMILHRAALGPTLVVAPASVCLNWADEAARFAPGLSILTLPSDRERLGDAGPHDLVITSYASLNRDSKHLRIIEWGTVVLDEAQAIKNPDSQRSRAARALQAGFKMALTGTPMENRLEELWSLFAFLNPGLLGDRSRFQRSFANPIARDGDVAALERLRSRIRPFLLRRTKDQVLQELPLRSEVVRRIELHPWELAHYEILRRQAVGRMDHSVAQLLADLTRLRLACCHIELIQPQLQNLPSSKLEALGELLDELRSGGHRALVFSQFVGFLELAEQVLKQEGIPYRLLTGSTPPACRKASIDAFQAGEGEVFLISLKAGGTGLNLTGADCVIHLDPWWNPAVEDQASSRAHRIGQTRPVTVYRLVAQGTIEERIVELHEHKRALAETFLAGTAEAAGLSAEELLALIRDPAPVEQIPSEEEDAEGLTRNAVDELLERGDELLPEEALQLVAFFRRNPALLDELLQTAEGNRLWTSGWVAGKLGDPVHLEALVDALERSNEEILAKALARMGAPGLEPLAVLAFSPASPQVCWEAVEGLTELGRLYPEFADRVAEVALTAIRDPQTSPEKRSEAACLLLDLNHQKSIKTMEQEWGAHLFDETGVGRSSLTEALVGRDKAYQPPAPSPDFLDELMPAHRVRFRQFRSRLADVDDAGGSAPDWKKRFEEDLESLQPRSKPTGPRAGRNERCPCGSGRKYKKCCLSADEQAQRSDPLLVRMQNACWHGAGYTMLPSEQLERLPRSLVEQHVALLTDRGPEVSRRLREETNAYLLLAGIHRFLSLERYREASDLVLLIPAAEPHPAVNLQDVRRLPAFPRDPRRHRHPFSYRLDLALESGRQALSWMLLEVVAERDPDFAVGAFERIWTTSPWTGWTAAALGEAAIMADVPDAGLDYLTRALERIQTAPAVHPGLPEEACPREVLDGYLAEIEECRQRRSRTQELWAEFSRRPALREYRDWEVHELDRRLHHVRYQEKLRELAEASLDGGEVRRRRSQLQASYRAEREALDQRSAELLGGLLAHPDHSGPIVAAAEHARGVLWVLPVKPDLSEPRELPLELERLLAEPPEDLRGRAVQALRNTVAELGSPPARLIETPWGDFLALHLRVEAELQTVELLALAETALWEVSDPGLAVITAESSELVALGAGCSLALPAESEPESDEPDESWVPGNQDLLRRVLQRMLRMGRVGAAHTDLNHFFRGVPTWCKGEMKTMLDLLVKDEYIRVKPTVTEPHISLEPRRLARVKQFLEDGPPPPGRIREYLEGRTWEPP
ncbi:MAG: SEC-C domain-containing protein [Armatimonadetes bacterium]|nr:SEC-C domain-containing protein [Armatimonadota bacterium]